MAAQGIAPPRLRRYSPQKGVLSRRGWVRRLLVCGSFPPLLGEVACQRSWQGGGGYRGVAARV